MADPLYPDFKIKSTFTTGTSPEVVFQGTGWTQNQTDNSGHNTGDKFATTSVTGDSVTINYAGEFTDAFIFGSVGKSIGKTRVIVDGKNYESEFDGFVYLDGTNVMRNGSYIRIKGLTRGTHTIKLVCAGTKNDAATGTGIGFSHAYIMNPDYPVGKQLPNVMFIGGDSITDSSSSYADKWIKDLIEAYKPGNKVRWEYGTRPGVTSDYLGKFFENEILSKRASGSSILIGTNDLPQPLVVTKNSLEYIIAISKKYKLGLQFGTIPPRNGLDPFSWNKVNGTIKELCMREGLPMMDFNKIVFNNTPVSVSPINSDGIHPDQIGHSLMSKVMFDTLIDPKNFFRNILAS